MNVAKAAVQVSLQSTNEFQNIVIRISKYSNNADSCQVEIERSLYFMKDNITNNFKVP